MIYDGKVYRNLEGQVAYLTEYLNANAVAAELGIKVVGQADNVSDIPEGEYGYGDAYMIGTEPPYTMYIWTRANGMHPEDYWFNVGTFPAPGPQGETGIGLDDVISEMLLAYQNSSATYDSTNGFYDVQINGTKTTTLSDSSTFSAPVELNVPIQTDGQVVIETGHSSNMDIDTVKIKLDRNLDDTYVLQRAPTSNIEGQPYIYGGYKAGTAKLNGIKQLPIRFDSNNVIMYPATGNSDDNNTFTGTGSACQWNTMLGKGNHMEGSNDNIYANTENLVFGGKNQIHSGVQDSATFGYRNEVYANQAFTHGYKNTNKGSESIVIGNQNTLNGTISIDTTGPDYDGASSNSKQCAVFGNKNTLGTANQQMLVAGDQNQVGSNSKWGFIAGSHQNIGKDNFCVNAIDYGNTTERYVEDCTMIGYYNHIYGGTDGDHKVYAANMIGHDNTNIDGNGNTISDIILLGSHLKPSQQGCTVIGKYNAPTVYDVFEIGNGLADDNRSNIFAVSDDPLDGPTLKLGSVYLTAQQLAALKALI